MDLVAEPFPSLEPPGTGKLSHASISVDSPHEILVSKLCALLSRSELRDLQDIQALLEQGEDLERALEDAPRKDGGFSPLVLAWTLKNFPLRKAVAALGWSARERDEIEGFLPTLVERITAAAARR